MNHIMHSDYVNPRELKNTGDPKYLKWLLIVSQHMLHVGNRQWMKIENIDDISIVS